MSKCHLWLDARRAKKDGRFPVKIAVAYGTALFIDSGISVEQDYWDAEKELYLGSDAKIVNRTLGALLEHISSRVTELRATGRFNSLTRQELKKLLIAYNADPERIIDERKTVFEVADLFLQTKDGRTRDIYDLTFRKMKDFSPGKLHFEDISKNWLHDYESFIGGKVNSRAIHLRNLRALCNFAIDENYTKEYPFRKYPIRTEETRKRSLSIDQMREILNCSVTDIQREYRDMFLLMFYLIGINAADLFTAHKADIIDGRLEYRRNKTGRLYSIKIEPEAAAIINRYAGKDYLLSPLDRYSSYRDYLHHMNNSLKTLGQTYRTSSKKIGEVICKDLSSYWSRHTWATFAADLDVPDTTISLALGHAIVGNRTTSIYIKRNRAKVDASNRKVIDYLYGRYGNEKDRF